MNTVQRCAAGFAVSWAILLAVSCASPPAASSTARSGKGFENLAGTGEDGSEVVPAATATPPGTPLSVPTRDQLKQNSADQAIVGFLEKGSPVSLRSAIRQIEADPRGLIDSNRVYLAVALELLAILYPLEKVTVALPSVTEVHPYIGALRSARSGLYDYNTGNADFLALVLPSLVLYSASPRGSWQKDAETALNKALVLNPESVLPPLLLGEMNRIEGRPDTARPFFERAWQIDSSCYPAGLAFARILTGEKKGKQALEVGTQLLKMYPQNIQIQKVCAEAAFSSEDWDTADPYIVEVLKSESGNADYLLMRARILIERKDYLRATSLLDAYATTDRTAKNFLLLRSRVLREWNKNPAQAVAVIQEAYQRYPSDTDVLFASAELAYQSGLSVHGAQGRDLALQVLGKDSAHAGALSLLASDYISNANWTLALQYANRLVGLNPTLQARTLLLRALAGSGQYAQSASLAKTLYAVNPANDELLFLYLQSLVKGGNRAEAQSLIQALSPTASTPTKSILLYFESTLAPNPDAELAALRSSLLANPRNMHALFAMYQWYFARKDYRKAQYYLKQVIAIESGNAEYTKLLSNLDELLAP